jgi:ABC-type lipoprotein export system ATPase subunit
MFIQNKYPRGSEWRKWDLHIHTPLSIVQGYGGDKEEVWDKFITALENLPSEVKVLGITDYYFIDGFEKVIRAKKQGRLKNIEKIFPILEFRIDTFASASEHKLYKINLHILFDLNDDSIINEINSVKKYFIERISILKSRTEISLTIDNMIEHSPDNTLESGFNEFIPGTEQVFELLSSPTWKNRHILFLGYNEWANLEKYKQLKNEKIELHKRANGFFTASEIDYTHKKKEFINEYGKRPLFHSKDIHSFEDLTNKYFCNTWIKADPSFDGLKHVFYEPEERLYLGKCPDKITWINNNKANIIDSIQLHSTSNNNEWFDNTGKVEFNSSLITIIGNKGSGKSALADIIALAGNNKKEQYSFLNSKKFLKTTQCRKYSSQIYYNDNYQNEVKLNNTNGEKSEVEKLVYLSQSFVNNLCENIDDPSIFQQEINRVIFSHIPKEECLGQHSLDSLIEKKAEASNKKINAVRDEINKINYTICEKENKIKDDRIISLKAHLAEKRRQLKQLIREEKPKLVEKPEADVSTMHIQKKIHKYNTIKERIEGIINSKRKALSKNNQIILNINNILQSIDLLYNNYQKIVDSINSLETESSIRADEIIHLTVKKEALEKIIVALENKKAAANKYAVKGTQTKYRIDESLRKLNNIVDEKHSLYNKYLENIIIWKQEIKNMKGEKNENGTLKYYRWELNAAKNKIPDELEALYCERKEQARQLLECIEQREDLLSSIYSKSQERVQDQADRFIINKNQFVEFDTDIELSPEFEDDFFQFISQNKSGTFYKKDAGSKQLKKIINSIENDKATDWIEFPHEIIRALKHNLAEDPDVLDKKYATDIDNILLAKLKKKELYNYLFCFKYLQPKFVIKYEGKRIDQLSPGEKGMVLLIFFLLIDKSKYPLIIDQPEENLDNETVFLRLVNFIKECKKERQIIIVTHNPNLAIACDAEQIIYCSMEKENKNNISYTSGSIENSNMKKHAIDVLEGTKPAFLNRQSKYDIEDFTLA